MNLEMDKLYKINHPNDNPKIDEPVLQTAPPPVLHVLNKEETNVAHHQDPLPYLSSNQETIT